ncbi:MAG: hypothetical protein DDT20_01035 [Firmicutes bacterium]|nr:hypothetical protein [Bacillota bacterium]
MIYEAGNCTIVQGDCLETLCLLPDRSVHCCVTSPPYWGLRDYGTGTWGGGDSSCDHTQPVSFKSSTLGASTGGRSEATHQRSISAQASPYRDICRICGARRSDLQFGLEPTPQEYVEKLVAVFREVRRVLHDDGTLWLNLGDSYAASRSYQVTDNKNPGAIPTGHESRAKPPAGLKQKDMVGIPWRVAFALQADGWYLRQDIIWAKPNPMPESVRDRCTKAHEYIFLLSKRERYYYDAGAIAEPMTGDTDPSAARNRWNREQSLLAVPPGKNPMKRVQRKPAGWDTGTGAHGTIPRDGRAMEVEYTETNSTTRNKRSVWTVTTKPFKGAHFATFPPDLIEPCILAGTSAKGACPHCGSPWLRIVEKGAPDLKHQQACGGDVNGKYDGQSTKNYAAAGAQDASATKARILAGMVSKVTVGWVPSCRCPSHEPVPCFVLDPFAGAGTVGVVANKHDRKSILLELNPEYCQMTVNRLSGVK